MEQKEGERREGDQPSASSAPVKALPPLHPRRRRRIADASCAVPLRQSAIALVAGNNEPAKRCRGELPAKRMRTRQPDLAKPASGHPPPWTGPTKERLRATPRRARDPARIAARDQRRGRRCRAAARGRRCTARAGRRREARPARRRRSAARPAAGAAAPGATAHERRRRPPQANTSCSTSIQLDPRAWRRRLRQRLHAEAGEALQRVEHERERRRPGRDLPRPEAPVRVLLHAPVQQRPATRASSAPRSAGASGRASAARPSPARQPTT